MASRADQMLSAQVILRPATPRRSAEPVTAENVHEVLPSPDAAALARREFEQAGFDVGPLVANSFSITGPARLFNKVLRTTRAGRSADLQLPVKGLPAAVAGVIEAITFTPPPDFGPTSY